MPFSNILGDRTRLAADLVESIEPGVGMSLKDSSVAVQMTLRMLGRPGRTNRRTARPAEQAGERLVITRALGIRDKPIAPGSPWQNGFAEG
jgi:hypothetical protein